jgi:hypothetical protein
MDDFGVNVLRRKMFIHAELTPMAKPKKPIVTTTKVGLVKVQIKTAVDIHPGVTPPELQDILHNGKAYCCLLCDSFSTPLPVV